MSARPGLCGGHWVTGVPTAIANYPEIRVQSGTTELKVSQAWLRKL